jgi:hypothetical protein
MWRHFTDNNCPGLTCRPKWPLSFTIICNTLSFCPLWQCYQYFHISFLQVTHFQNENCNFELLCDSAPLFKIIVSHMPLWSIHIMKLSGYVQLSKDYVCQVLKKGCLACSVQHNNDFAVVLFKLHYLSWVDMLTDKGMCNFNSCSSLTEVGSILCVFQRWFPSWLNKNLRLSCECFSEHTKLTCLSFCKTSQV